MLDPFLAGHLTFQPSACARGTSRHWGRASTRLACSRLGTRCWWLPDGIDSSRPTPLMVLFHGGGGHAEKILPMMDSTR